MSVIIGRLKLRWNADSRIEPLENVAPDSPVTQRWMASRMHIVGRALSVLLGPDAVFHGVLLVTYAFLATWGVLHHAMWRDELLAWQVAVDSRSLGELFSNLRLERHPWLWQLLLYGLSRFTANPVAMQLLHLAFAVTTVWVFLRFSPFRRVEKALFIFGYFPFYEYGLISRDYYLLVVLFVFLLCTLLQNRPGRYMPMAIVLFCLANTHVYGFVLALAFFAFLICEYIFWGRSGNRTPHPRWKLVSAVSLTILGFALALWKCLLVPTSSWQHSLTSDRLAESVMSIWRGYVPIPFRFPFLPCFAWGTNFLDLAAPHFAICVLSVGLGIAAAGLLLDRPKGIFLYGLITIGLLVFQFVVYSGPLRCAGILFIGLVAVYWLSASTFERKTYSGRLRSICQRIPGWRRAFLILLLVAQLGAGLYAYSAEHFCPFSGYRDAAQFLRRHGLAQTQIVASPGCVAQGLAAYLQRSIYSVDRARLLRHEPLDEAQPAPAQKIIESAYHLFEKDGEDVVVAVGFALTVTVNGTTSPLSEIYCGPNGLPYEGANGMALSPSEVRQLPLPIVKVKKMVQFDKVIVNEPCFIYLLGLEPRVEKKAWEAAYESFLLSPQ